MIPGRLLLCFYLVRVSHKIVQDIPQVMDVPIPKGVAVPFQGFPVFTYIACHTAVTVAHCLKERYGQAFQSRGETEQPRVAEKLLEGRAAHEARKKDPSVPSGELRRRALYFSAWAASPATTNFRSVSMFLKLVVAGDAAHAEKYKALLRELAAGDRRILFPGFVSGPPLEELFSNARLFCLPSTLEGLPIALLEAMSYGNCCVASDIRENRETLEGHGYTFRNRDAHDLRNVLDDLMRNPDKVEAKKQVARDHVLRHYSWDLIADRMEELYRSLLEEQRGR